MVIRKTPITLRLEPITECILPHGKGAANATQTAIMITTMPRDSRQGIKAWPDLPRTASALPARLAGRPKLRQQVAKRLLANVSGEGKFRL